ncbi:MAG: hypothetical protein ACREHG_03330 [Candidatus Saccharimonadales bacterium]
MGTTPITLQTPQQVSEAQQPQAQAPPVDLNSLFSDPEFNSAPLVDQITVLSKVDPEYAQFSPEGYFKYRSQTKYPLSKQQDPNYQPTASTKDRVINFLRPIVAGVPASIAAAAASEGGPMASAGALIGTALPIDMGMQELMDNPTSVTSRTLGLPEGSLESKMANSASMLLGNELGGRVTGQLLKGLRNASKTTGVTDILTNLYKQRFGNNPLMRAARTVLPLKNVPGQSQQEVSSLIQKSLKSNIDASQQESNDLANQAKLIAGRNSFTFNFTKKVENKLEDGTTEVKNVKKTKTVQGPTYLNNLAGYAHTYLKNSKLRDTLTSDPLAGIAKAIITLTNAKFSKKTGELKTINPISFSNAWLIKRELEQQYSKTPFVASFASELNSDIDDSIPRWSNDSANALKFWQASKQTVAQRHQLFDKDGVAQIIDTTNSPLPDVAATIKDPMKLGRALAAGNLKLPAGRVVSTNIRQDLRGYVIKELINDPNSAVDKFTDPNMQRSYDQLFGPYEKKEVTRFFNSLQKGGYKNSIANARGWLMPGAIGLSAAFMRHGISPWETGAIVAAGYKLGSIATQRLITNPKTAKLMEGLLSNKPLGVSDSFAARTIASVLNGTTLSIIDSEGQEHPGRIQNGKFVPAPNINSLGIHLTRPQPAQ